MEQTESSDTVQALQRDVLQKAAQELMGGQGHRPSLVVATVTVGEGDGVVAASKDGLVAERGAMDVAAEVVEHGVGLMTGLAKTTQRLFQGMVGNSALETTRRARCWKRPRK